MNAAADLVPHTPVDPWPAIVASWQQQVDDWLAALPMTRAEASAVLAPQDWACACVGSPIRVPEGIIEAPPPGLTYPPCYCSLRVRKAQEVLGLPVTGKLGV